MNNTLKSIFAIIGLVLIGFIAGYQTHKYSVRTTLRKIAKERPGPQFEGHLLRILEVSPEKAARVKPILEKYGDRLYALQEDMRLKREPILDSLQMELGEHLSPRQMRRMQRITDRMQRFDRPRHKKNRRAGKKRLHKRSNE